MASTFPLGSVSSGTLKQPDLIAAFAAALDDLEPGSALAAEAQEYNLDSDPEEGEWLLEELFEKLDDIAPQYCYFGAHPDDGADFGFWVNWESIDADISSGELLKITTLGEIPANYNGSALLTSNGDTDATLYSVENGVASEVWSTV